jgi:hypothetical protein
MLPIFNGTAQILNPRTSAPGLQRYALGRNFSEQPQKDLTGQPGSSGGIDPGDTSKSLCSTGSGSVSDQAVSTKPASSFARSHDDRPRPKRRQVGAYFRRSSKDLDPQVRRCLRGFRLVGCRPPRSWPKEGLQNTRANVLVCRGELRDGRRHATD